MVENSEHNAKRTFTQLFNDFVSIVNMVVVTTVVLLLIRVEAVVRGFIQTAPLSAAWQLGVLASPPLPLLHVEIVHGLVLMNFLAFNFCEVVAKTFNRFSNCHWKFMLADMCNGRRSISIGHLHTHRRRYVDFYDLAARPDRSWGLQCGTSGAKIYLRKLKFLLHRVFHAVQLITQGQACLLVSSGERWRNDRAGFLVTRDDTIDWGRNNA